MPARKPKREQAPVLAPPDPPSPQADAYERKRLAAAGRSRAESQAGREIGPVPEIANVRRRTRARRHPKVFCTTYLAEAFPLAFAPHHDDEFERLKECAELAALYALADPRGDGKTTRVRGFALWVIANAVLDYELIVGANIDKAKEAIETLKLWMRYAPEFGADYPEIAVAVRHLRGIAQRATGQTCQEESTLIDWGQTRLVLPTVPVPPNYPKGWPRRADGKAPTSGAIVGATGLTGEGIRGSVITTSDGRMLRPKLVLLDDPQTDESAHSKTQNATRKKLISSAILGLAGPGEKIAAVMPCTVIAKGDAVDELLDRSRHPLWRGTRRGILKSMPTDLKAWDAYFEVYDRCALAEPPDFAEANAYYVAHRAELDAGAAATWEERKEPDDVSAIQHAMHLYHRDKWAFWSEYMNAPLTEDTGPVARKLESALVAARHNGVPRLTVPREATRLVAMIDVGEEILWYVVAAFDERFSGGVVDYGTWPPQPAPYFAAADPPAKLSDQYPGLAKEQRVYAGLRDLTELVLDRAYVRHSTNETRSVEQCLVDEGHLDQVVYQFCRESRFAHVLMPSKGHVPRTLGAMPMAGWQARAGERAAKRGQPSWRVGPVGTGKGRHCLFEANEWKSHVARLLQAAPGGGGCLRLFGDAGADHQLLADHCTAEFAVEVIANGRRLERWEQKPAQDNHLWDCLVGAAVAAGTLGLEWFADATRAGPDPPAPPVSLKELQERQRAGGASARPDEPVLVPTTQPMQAPGRPEPVSLKDLQRQNRKGAG